MFYKSVLILCLVSWIYSVRNKNGFNFFMLWKTNEKQAMVPLFHKASGVNSPNLHKNQVTYFCARNVPSLHTFHELWIWYNCKDVLIKSKHTPSFHANTVNRLSPIFTKQCTSILITPEMMSSDNGDYRD